MDTISVIDLSADEGSRLFKLSAELSAKYLSVENPAFVRVIDTAANMAPDSVKEKMASIRTGEIAPICLVKGYPLDAEAIRPTPDHWDAVMEAGAPSDFYFAIMSSLVGDIFGFSNLQGGKLIQEIFPIRNDAGKQLGTGSVELYLHTEDSSLDYRADFLGFFCNRNPDNIPTQVAVPNLHNLSLASIDVLKNPNFKILNDREAIDDDKRADHFSICSIVYPWQSGLGMRYDPLYLEKRELSLSQTDAVAELMACTERAIIPVNLNMGEIAFIDNHRCAHGRSEFQPRYDGTDRWLKRTQISTRLQHFLPLVLPHTNRVLP